jgi:hypothetical protein
LDVNKTVGKSVDYFGGSWSSNMTIPGFDSKRLMQLCQAAAMSGGFFLLLCEIRFEHRAAVIDDWRPWIPIVFCGLMVILIPLATFAFGRAGRRLLIGLYGLTMCVGALGGFFHSEGHFVARLMEIVTVWTGSLQSGAAIKAAHPPLLAPFAFMGLGSIGLIFCLGEPAQFHEKLLAGDKA